MDATLFWGWLALERKAVRYDKLYEQTVGLGLERETRHGAAQLVQLQRREREIEQAMRHLMKDLRFTQYRKVFASFGFGERVEALILSQIYPLENYLVDGKPEIRIRKGKNSGQPTKRHLSRRRFQKALGVAPTREDSGDKHSSKKAGSSRMAHGAMAVAVYPRRTTTQQSEKSFGQTIRRTARCPEENLPRETGAREAVSQSSSHAVSGIGEGSRSARRR